MILRNSPQPPPLVNLYDPENQLVWSVNGFDTDRGLDDLVKRLESIFSRR